MAEGNKLPNVVTPQFYTAIKKANEAGAFLREQSQKYAQVLEQMEAKQVAMDNLDAEFEIKQRKARIQFALDLAEYKDTTARKYLSNEGFTVVSNEEYSNLKQLSVVNQQAISEAVDKATKAGERSKKAALATQESQHKLAVANLEAQNVQQAREIEFLTSQIESLKGQLKSTMETAERMVQAATQSKVNISTGK